MKRAQLAEDSQVFAHYAEQAIDAVKADRVLRRRFETARRRLTRSILRIYHVVSDEQLVLFAEYVLLITA